MKTTLSKKELREKAVKVFQQNTGSVIYATTDGQMFYNKNRAALHANGSKDKLGVYDFAREDVEEDTQQVDDFKKLESVSKLKKQLPEIKDVLDLEAMLEIENHGEQRKTAIAAIEERIKEISQPAPDPTLEPETKTPVSNQEEESKEATQETTKTEE